MRLGTERYLKVLRYEKLKEGEPGFVIRIAPLSVSRESRIKMKKSFNIYD